VLDADGAIRSNVISSQEQHGRFGGVVPEIAARHHLELIDVVIDEALLRADVALADVQLVAATQGPGLIGALLVGLSSAKALAAARGLPFAAVDHLQGHVAANFLQGADGPFEPPFVCLIASGGHTLLARVSGYDGFEVLGRTLDDAAGEAFDKVAKLLGLGYPGGPWIDALAPHGDPTAVAFSLTQVKQKAHRPGSPVARFPFSFSGIKTAVLRYVQIHDLYPSIERRRKALANLSQAGPADSLPLCDAGTLGLIASFQRAVVDDLKRKTFQAAEALGAESILVSGGVAANRELRARFTHEAERRGLPIAFPSVALSTDNAAMIAAAAWPRLLAGEFAPMDLTAEASLALGTK
jgi:N6-L-threonylcarbamoyladenine synthase